MSNATSVFLSTSPSFLNTQLLEIEHTDIALRGWLQKQGTEILPDSLFIAASVLFELVDPHDLISLLDMSLREIATHIQLQQEEESRTVLAVQRGRCLMEEKMYRAQMEVSLFSKAIADLCEKVNTMTNSTNSPTPCFAPKKLSLDAVGYVGSCQEFSSANFDCLPPTRYKCMAWLSACRKATEVGNNASGTLLHDSSHHVNETLLKPGDQILYLPGYLKAFVDDGAYRTYASASVTETNESLVRTDSFKAESKTLDKLKSEFRIMYWKKQRAQAEVDMYSEALPRIVEGMSAASATIFESRPPDHVDDWFDDWHSGPSLSSNASGLL